MPSSNRSPFERLKAHFDENDLECPECGHFDEDGEWQAETDGARVIYRHGCPSCATVHSRTIDAN
ncbi:MAG: HVO_0649 family zinc finger protein [Halobacterium sp.]